MESLFRNTLGPVAWTALLLVPPAIFALYFLKLKRTPLEVPSTYLWTKVIEDLHVNSLWQRLRKSLLLLLQLLVVALAILAVLRPGWQGESLTGQRFIFLIDRSASMASTDGADGSRLATATQRVRELVDQLESDMSAMILTFADQPDVVQEFTSNRRLLREALDRIEPSSASTQVRGALELADGFANPARVTIEQGGAEVDATAQQPVELYLFSDGLFGPVDGFSLGNLRPKFLPVGKLESGNLAITAFNTRRGEARPELRQAFVQVANYSETAHQMVVELLLDGRLLDAARLEVPPGDAVGVAFDLDDTAIGALEARLDIPSDFQDVLADDNRAYAVLDRVRDVRVLLVTRGNTALETAFATERATRLAAIQKISPADLAGEATQRDLQDGAYDLVVFDACDPATMPEAMPAANTVWIGRLPPLEGWRGGSSQEPAPAPQIIDWQRQHPLLSLIELGNVQMVDSLILEPPLGGKVLIDSTSGPIAAIAPRQEYEDVVLGFEIVGRNANDEVTLNTNWPRRYSFPGFWLNVLEYLGGELSGVAPANRPGDPVSMTLREAEGTYEVRLPDGTQVPLETGPGESGEGSGGRLGGGKIDWTQTAQLGIYELLGDGEVVTRFAVNLLDPVESDIRLRPRQEATVALETVESISLGFVDVAAESLRSPVRQEWWQGVLLVALALLLLEWYIYNRRVYL